MVGYHFHWVLVIAAVVLLTNGVFADTGNMGAWGDQGDGTFKNPIIPADFSDIDAIRVGSDYYAISSTMQYSPGMVILHSSDLVSWTILGHAVNDLSAISPEMNWDRMNRYGHGIWAGAIRFHDGKFWIYFGTPEEGYFVTTAINPAGPWAPPHRLTHAAGWDDCCPFWDDDGQGYFVGTHFKDGYKIHLFKLTPDGLNLVEGFDKVIHQSKGSEANKFYKFNGIYYHYYSEVRPEGRVAMMERGKNLDGPWEVHQLNHVSRLDKQPNQGGIIQTPGGDWWFVTHQGVGDWEGRALVLLPITWSDGWPIIGKPGSDGIGNMVWTAKKSIAGFAAVVPQSSDEFDGSTLAPQWEWNHQPRPLMWSLTERPGFLRLKAFKSLRGDDLKKAGNTLTQRVVRAEQSEATIKMDIGGMADGQYAGLCHFAKTSSTLGIRQQNGARRLECNNNSKITKGPAITVSTIWLRSNWGQDGQSRYSYSLDGHQFTSIGDMYPLSWGDYRGDRIGIFSYNNDGEAGQVDIDFFHYTYLSPALRSSRHVPSD